MNMNRNQYYNLVDLYQKQLDEMICPKCGKGKPSIVRNYEEQSLAVICSFCMSGKWNRYQDFVREYKRYKENLPIKDSLRRYEKNTLKNAIYKNISKIILRVEDVITREDYENAIINNPKSLLSLYNNLNEILQTIKLCSKVEQQVIKEILELSAASGQIIDLEIPSKQRKCTLELMRYKSSSSIIAEISERLKINNVRYVITRLMNKGLVAFCESDGYIDTHPLLVENRQKIDEFQTPQKIENELKYKVFSKYDFKCSNCCESNMPLKIAYLRKDKKTDDLNFLIPLCQVCFDSLTENEIMIDGTAVIYSEKDNFKAWRFISGYYPNLGIRAYKVFYLLALKYGENNLIKATAIALNAIDEGKKFAGVSFFYKYIKKILDNAVESNNEVKVSSAINRKYNINEWMKLI